MSRYSKNYYMIDNIIITPCIRVSANLMLVVTLLWTSNPSKRSTNVLHQWLLNVQRVGIRRSLAQTQQDWLTGWLVNTIPFVDNAFPCLQVFFITIINIQYGSVGHLDMLHCNFKGEKITSKETFPSLSWSNTLKTWFA